MQIIQQLPALKIPNLLIVHEVVTNGLMVTVAGVKSPQAFIRLREGNEPRKWTEGLKYIRVDGTKGAPYKRHILDLFKSQRDAWMIAGQGPLWCSSIKYKDCDEDEMAENAIKFIEMNSINLLDAHGYAAQSASKRISQK